MIQTFYDGRSPYCSLCDKSITGKGMHILDFHFHQICADNTARTLRLVNALNQ